MYTIIGILAGVVFGLIAFVVYVRVSTNIEKKRAEERRQEMRNKRSERSESVRK